MLFMCEYCFAELSRSSLTKHHTSRTCEVLKTSNDNYIPTGRTYLKGKSPFEGVWHDTHMPYDIHEIKVNTIQVK